MPKRFSLLVVALAATAVTAQVATSSASVRTQRTHASSHSASRSAVIAKDKRYAHLTSAAGARTQTTQLISHALGGGLPNGASTHAVISNDKRYARMIAFQSDASNLVRNDINGQTDVFAIRRRGHVGNKGTPWRGGPTKLVSRTFNGAPANGPSFAPAVSGAFHSRPRCIGFLSAASNLVGGDTNGRIDAFVVRRVGAKPSRLLLPGRVQGVADTTRIAVSGDCSRIAFVTGGRLFEQYRGRTRLIRTVGQANDPAFSTGLRDDLVFGAARGVYLSRGGTRRPRLVAPGGRNPVYNDIKRHALAYEISAGDQTQVAYKDLGHRQRIISGRYGHPGNGSSRNPVIGNSGYYVAFESDADNLSVNSRRRVGDPNHHSDVYLYTDVRNLTLVQSVKRKAEPLPGGGANPSMSFYANYILFDSPGPLGSLSSPHQVYMRYLGGL